MSDVLDRRFNLVLRENSVSSLGRHLLWNLVLRESDLMGFGCHFSNVVVCSSI